MQAQFYPKVIARIWIKVIVWFLGMCIIAGRWDMPAFWAYAAVLALLGLISGFFGYSPDLVKERLRPGPGAKDAGTLAANKVLVLLHYGVAALDMGRFHWSDSVPFVLQTIGFAGFAAGLCLLLWSTAVNRFFSSVVRVQTDRGHQVVSSGPYEYVRHPGYLAMVVGFPLSALALGSWWSLAPLGGYSLVIFRRLLVEDRFLKEHLEGYKEYAERVPHRLIPGVW